MKKYNKPFIEIGGFEAKDVVAVSVEFPGFDTETGELQSVYKDYVTDKGGVNHGDRAIVLEW